MWIDETNVEVDQRERKKTSIPEIMDIFISYNENILKGLAIIEAE